MKLSKIPKIEETIKRSYSFKASTVTMLNQYQAAVVQAAQSDVEMKDIVEQMLLDFMAEDKDFQRWRKDQGAKPASGVTPVEPAPAQPKVEPVKQESPVLKATVTTPGIPGFSSTNVAS